jgi:DNA-binding response OmpR family regulator
VSAKPPNLVILDLQIGNMGGMATCMDLRLEVGAGRLAPVPILMLLDRAADVFLAQQAGAEGWLVKPLDAFRLKMASVKLLSGGNMRDEVTGSSEAENAIGGFEPTVSDHEDAGGGLDQPDDEVPVEAV